MRLESAVYACSEGLNVQGQAISVVGDNISNSNTTGYKQSRVEFADLFAGASGTATNQVNDSSGGDGVKITAVRQLQTPGSVELTGRNLDAGIEGNGFFIVQNSAKDQLFSRAGNFSINSDGLLVNAQGNTVMGYTAANGTTLSTINMTKVDSAATPTTTITLSGNLNANDAVGTPPTAPATFADLQATGAGTFRQDMQAYDSLGKPHNVAVVFTKTNTPTRTWTAQAFMDSGDTGGTAGTPKLVGSYTGLSFDQNGVVPTASQANSKINVTGVAYSNGAAAGAFTIDLSQFNQYSAPSQVTAATNNGQGTGNISSYEIQKDGSVVAVLNSGSRKTVGTIALANFNNVDALNRVGNTEYTATTDAALQTPAAPGTKGLGALRGGGLENSTVDIAHEFVNLVLYQRSYQASSQTLSAANGLLKDTLGLIR